MFSDSIKLSSVFVSSQRDVESHRGTGPIRSRETSVRPGLGIIRGIIENSMLGIFQNPPVRDTHT